MQHLELSEACSVVIFCPVLRRKLISPQTLGSMERPTIAATPNVDLLRRNVGKMARFLPTYDVAHWFIPLISFHV